MLPGKSFAQSVDRLRLLTFPMRTTAYSCHWSDAGSPSFQCLPSARDVLLDPGRATAPRIAALLMLRSTISTVSAPTTCLFRGSITHPTQLLCTLRGRRYRRLTQHLLPGGSLGPTRAGLSPAGLHQLWLAPSEIQARISQLSQVPGGAICSGRRQKLQSKSSEP